MDNLLKEELIFAMLNFRKSDIAFPAGLDMRMGELLLMNAIAGNISCSDENFNVSDISYNLHVTKAAVSQMLNALEKKGYIDRGIDKSDRRKIVVVLTIKGQEILKQTKEDVYHRMEKTIARFGEEDIRHLIKLMTRFADISKELDMESKCKHSKIQNVEEEKV